MEKATISELKDRLSAYLAKVKAGQSVLVFERDRPIARIEKVDSPAFDDDRLARLERAGLLRRARNPVSTDTLRTPVPGAEAGVLDALLEERRTGR